MNTNKYCCDRATCPKRHQQKEESSIQSSSVEEMNEKTNKETQMSASITSSTSVGNSLTAKTCEKSSEAYFDRNNQNISFCQNKFCPSNSSQTSQTESHMRAFMLSCPPVTICCIKCKRPLQNICNTTTTLTMPETSGQKVSCKQLNNTSSSSSSTASEHFPVNLSLKSNFVEKEMPLPKIRQRTQQVKPIFVSSTAPRPQHLQPLTSTNSMSSNFELFHSCSSEDSESENTSHHGSSNKLSKKLQRSRKRCKQDDNNSVILKLLHEVVHLINKDNPIRDEALSITQAMPSSIDKKSSKITTQESKIKVQSKPENFEPPTTTQFTPLAWPPTCLCCAYAMALGQGQPFYMPAIQPYNLMSPAAATTTQIPEPFVYKQTNDSFKECYSSGNNSLLADQIPDKLCCICSNITDICPKHGPLNEMLKKANFPSLQNSICKLQIKTKPDSSKVDGADDDMEPRFEGKPNTTATELKEDVEEDVDEELHPRYVDKKCIDPTDSNVPSPDCLLVYDDEEPQQAEDIVDVDEEIQPIFVEQNPFESYEPCLDCLMEYDDEEPQQAEDIVNVDEEIQPSFVEQNPFESYEPCLDCLMEYDDEEPSWPDLTNNALETTEVAEVNDLQTIEDHVIKSEIIALEELLKPKVTETLDNKTIAEVEKSSQNLIDVANTELPVTETERSPYIVETSPTTGQNVYNFLSAIDEADVDGSQKIIRYNDSEKEFDFYNREEETELLADDEYELAKEIRAESRKEKKLDTDDIAPTDLATIKQLEGEGSPKEMKFFIDSLIMDFEAMEYARRKSQFEKNICITKSRPCTRDSFPVTITDVTDLGANSLYVKWTIHDCCSIGGYEIYTDGYLTNRYYNSRHEAAVITHVDVTLPHKVALVAQPTADDGSLEIMCNAKNKPKCLTWKTDVEKELKSCAALWIPSIFLYNPDPCRTTVAPPIMRDNF